MISARKAGVDEIVWLTSGCQSEKGPVQADEEQLTEVDQLERHDTDT
jgi:hypothetical protein